MLTRSKRKHTMYMMTKNKKSAHRVVVNSLSHKVIALLAIFIFGGVGMYVLTQSNAQTPGPMTSSRPRCSDLTNDSSLPRLAPGDSGTCVLFLQWAMGRLQYTDPVNGSVARNYDLEPTGIFDSATRAAVIDFQAKLNSIGCTAQVPDTGLATSPPADGSVENVTWYFITTFSGQPGFPSGSSSCGPGNPLI